MKLILLIFSSLIFRTAVFSQLEKAVESKRSITVRVVDSETKKPIRDVKILIPGTDLLTTTNVVGYFQIEIDTSKVVALEAAGYESSRISLPETDKFQVELKKKADDPTTLYLDEYGFGAEKQNAKFYRVIKENPDDPAKALAIEYRMNGTMKTMWSFLPGDLYTKEGRSIDYYLNGKRAEEGFYKDNARIGKWTFWYATGQMKAEWNYDRYKDPKRRSEMVNYWDSLGNQQVIQGSGIQTIYGELGHQKGEIKNGVRYGTWKGIFKNGKIAFEEEYENGRLSKGHSFDEAGKEFKYDEEDNFSLKKFYEFIGKTVRYPADARKYVIEGKVLIHMLVDPEGKILKTFVVNGIGGGCDEEAIRVVMLYSGKWSWGKRRGQPYKPEKPRSIFFPLVFKLG